jgi:hypothetical protein
MHQSMQSGSMARAASTRPQSSLSHPNSSSTRRTTSFAPASSPQMNIVGRTASLGSTNSALPTLEKAFTNRAAGARFCSRSMSESLGPVV